MKTTITPKGPADLFDEISVPPSIPSFRAARLKEKFLIFERSFRQGQARSSLFRYFSGDEASYLKELGQAFHFNVQSARAVVDGEPEFYIWIGLQRYDGDFGIRRQPLEAGEVN